MVKDWFRTWKCFHAESFPGAGFPEPRAPFWDPTFKHFVGRDVQRYEAEEITRRLAERGDHSPGTFHSDVAGELDAVRAVAALGGMVDRDAAQAASRNCVFCDGMGLATVHRVDDQPFQAKTAAGLAFESAEIVMACTCPFGRWLLEQHKRPPWPDLAKYEGQVAYRRLEQIDDDAQADAEFLARNENRRVNFWDGRCQVMFDAAMKEWVVESESVEAMSGERIADHE